VPETVGEQRTRGAGARFSSSTATSQPPPPPAQPRAPSRSPVAQSPLKTAKSSSDTPSPSRLSPPLHKNLNQQQQQLAPPLTPSRTSVPSHGQGATMASPHGRGLTATSPPAGRGAGRQGTLGGTRGMGDKRMSGGDGWMLGDGMSAGGEVLDMDMSAIDAGEIPNSPTSRYDY